MQLVDARDLAAFLLDCGEHGTGGTFNATAPPGNATMGSWLQDCVDVTGVDAAADLGRRRLPAARTRSSRGPSCRCGCRRGRTATTSGTADASGAGRGRAAAPAGERDGRRHLGLDAGRRRAARRARRALHVGRHGIDPAKEAADPRRLARAHDLRRRPGLTVTSGRAGPRGRRRPRPGRPAPRSARRAGRRGRPATGQPRCRACRALRRRTPGRGAAVRTERPASPARPAAARRRSPRPRGRSDADQRGAQLVVRHQLAQVVVGPGREGATGGEHRVELVRDVRVLARAAGRPAARRPRRRQPRVEEHVAGHRRPGRPPGRAEQRQQVAGPGVARPARSAGSPPTCGAGARRRATKREAYGGRSSSCTVDARRPVAPRAQHRPAAGPTPPGRSAGCAPAPARCVAASSVTAPGCPRLGDRGHPSRPPAPDHRQGRRARQGGALLRPRGRLLRRPAPDHPRRRRGAAGRAGDARD